MAKSKKTKKFKVKPVSIEVLVNAYLESLYFNPQVKKISIKLKKNSNQELELICTGRGRLRGKVSKNVAEVWITGTEKELAAWEKFFKDFYEVPEFSLREYTEWLKGRM